MSDANRTMKALNHMTMHCLARQLMSIYPGLSGADYFQLAKGTLGFSRGRNFRPILP